MNDQLAYLNGEFVPADQARVPVEDAGFMLGTTVAEQLRTFKGRLFRLDQHIERLCRSLGAVGVELPIDSPVLHSAAEQLVAANHPRLAAGDDLGLSMFVTPGLYSSFAPGRKSEPMVCMHTYPIAFQLFAAAYHHGQSLVIPEIRQVPSACWPASLKCRSRMHYYLADKQAAELEPGSRALLLDLEGKVAEASTASVFIYQQGEGLVAPPAEQILPGISLAVVKQLAAELDIAFQHRELWPDDVAAADEVILCSTSPCLLPVVRLQQQPIAGGEPGAVYQRLLRAWSELVGVDIAAQAQEFAKRLMIDRLKIEDWGLGIGVGLRVIV